MRQFPGCRVPRLYTPGHWGGVRTSADSHVQADALEHDEDAKPSSPQHAGERRAGHRTVRGAHRDPVQPGAAVLLVRDVRADMHDRLPARPDQAVQIGMREGQVRLRTGHEAVQPHMAGESCLRRTACV